MADGGVHAVEWEMSPPQSEMVNAVEWPEVYFIGGVRSGKTYSTARAFLLRLLENPQHVKGIVVAPYHKMLGDPVIPTLETAAQECGCTFKHVKDPQDPHLLIDGHKVFLRTAEKPDSIAAVTCGVGWMTEAALCDSEANDRFAQRISDPDAKHLVRLYDTTPEGTNTWVHKRDLRASTWDKAAGPCPIKIIRATTDSAFWLTPQYLANLRELYADDPAGLAQYMDGIATNGTGTIYRVPETAVQQFDRTLLRHGEIVVGWDFNWSWMVSVIGVWLPSYGALHVIGEVVSREPGGTDTAEHAAKVVTWLQRQGLTQPGYRGLLVDQRLREITAFCDQSGANRSANSPVTSEAAVRAAGFLARFDTANPLVRNRIAAVNRALKRGQLLIDGAAAPETLTALRTHDRDKHGEPRKKWGPKDPLQADHYCDALGYMVWGVMPYLIESTGVH